MIQSSRLRHIYELYGQLQKKYAYIAPEHCYSANKEPMLKNPFDIKWLIISVICIMMVLTFSHLPKETNHSDDNRDYFDWNQIFHLQLKGSNALAHVLVYGAMTVFLSFSVKSFPSKHAVLIIFIAVLSIGAFDEITQPIVNRSWDLTDWLADIVGIIVVLPVLVYLKTRSASKGKLSLP